MPFPNRAADGGLYCPHGTFPDHCGACMGRYVSELEARIKELEAMLEKALPYLERGQHYAEVRYDREDDYGAYRDMKNVVDLVCEVKSVLAAAPEDTK